VKIFALSTFKKNALLNTWAVGIPGLFYWAVGIVAVRVSGYEDAGVWAVVNSFSLNFLYLAEFGVYPYQISDVEGKHSDMAYLKFKIGTSLLAFVVFCLSLFFVDFSARVVLCSFIMMVLRIAENLSSAQLAVLQRFMRYDMIAISRTIKAVLCLLVFTGVLAVFNLPGALASMTFVFILVFYVYDWRKVRADARYTIRCGQTDYRIMAEKCLPIMLNTLIYPFQIFFTRYIISLNFSEAEVGLYSSVTVFLILAVALVNPVFNVLIPDFTVFYQHKKIHELKITLLKAGVFIVVISGVLYGGARLFGSWGLILIYGPEIAPYVYLLPISIFTTSLIFVLNFLNTLLTSFRMTRIMFAVNFSGLISCCIATKFFVDRFGMIGACYSLAVSIAIQILCTFIAAARALAGLFMRERLSHSESNAA
jgi:O-antigen/teichoic acid export membrane protein